MNTKQVKSGFCRILMLLYAVFALVPAAQAQSALPGWLQAHIGDRPNQVVFKRARASYLRLKKEGTVTNPCYIAMDATKRHDMGGEEMPPGDRAYLICEDTHTFMPFSAGHGAGTAVLHAQNSKGCAKHFGNAYGSNMTTGGTYWTGTINRSIKGKLRNGEGTFSVYSRSFLRFEGEGLTGNAKKRDLGLHAAVALTDGCYQHEPSNPIADEDGDVFMAEDMRQYVAGRSNGCLSVTEDVSDIIMPIAEKGAMAIYVYPEASDIQALAEAVRAGKKPEESGVYWSKECLNEIKSPVFWDRETYEEKIKREKPVKVPEPKKMCPGSAPSRPAAAEAPSTR
jgi:hypothetical protein